MQNYKFKKVSRDQVFPCYKKIRKQGKYFGSGMR